MHASFAGKGRGRKGAPPPAPALPESMIEAQILRDMKATEARVARREADYLTFAAARQAGRGRRRRKFLGLF
jgi:hypothetical protein